MALEQPLPPAAADAVRHVSNAAERACSLTHQLLAFTRRKAAALELLNLNTAVTAPERMLHRVIGEDVGLVVSTDPGTPAVYLDPVQLDQIDPDESCQ